MMKKEKVYASNSSAIAACVMNWVRRRTRNRKALETHYHITQDHGLQRQGCFALCSILQSGRASNGHLTKPAPLGLHVCLGKRLGKRVVRANDHVLVSPTR